MNRERITLEATGCEDKPVVFVYADPLLPPSETFILGQGEALEGFTPYYIGPKWLERLGLEMPPERTLAINGIPGQIGRIREAPFRYCGVAPFYFRRLRKLQPVLLHAHFGPGGLRALGLAEWLGIPLITTFHGFEATMTDAFALRAKYGHRHYVRRRHVLAQRGQLFIAVSQFIKSKILEQGFPEGKTVVHYTGVDTEFFKADRGIVRDPVVLFVGTLHEGKGCEFVIRAVAKVQSTIPEVELVIIGNGPLRSRLEQLAKGELRRCKFLGTQPREIVRHWMNRARVFSTASVTAKSGWTEGFGMVFAEAQAMCLPVASFASGGIPEVVAHGETGLLAKERDWEGLADNLRTLLLNWETWRRMSEAGRARVELLFNLKRQTAVLEELYCSATRASRSSPAEDHQVKGSTRGAPEWSVGEHIGRY